MDLLFLMWCPADVLGWAHYHMQRLLPVISHGPTIFYAVYCRCTRMGPLENIEAAADDFAWAHYFLHGALPMHPDCYELTPLVLFWTDDWDCRLITIHLLRPIGLPYLSPEALCPGIV